MPNLQSRPERVLGFDVAKNSITIFDSATQTLVTIDNAAAAIARFVRGLGANCLAVLEPTGGHERKLVAELIRAAVPCHRADTLKVKAFIRSFGTLAKTDALDARALARYGRERWDSLALFALPDKDVARLAELVTRRRQLVAMKVAETNRAKAPGAALRRCARALLRTIDTQIRLIERAVDDLLAASEPLRRTVALYRTLPGVGPRTATTLAALMPELGQLTRRQAASLAAVAPHPRDSGTLRGYRSMRGGRPDVRAALFMAALAASRSSSPLGQFYNRLIQNAKKPIVAIAALMRKIIVILNAKQREAIALKLS